MKFEFTKDEVSALIQLIDLAVKAGGLSVAEAGIVLVKKLQKPEPETKDEVD